MTDETIKCGDCGISLVEIVISETNEERQLKGLKENNLKVKILDCPKCGGSSFDSKVFRGSTNILTSNDKFYLENDDTSIVDGVIYSILRVKKHEKQDN